MNYATLKLVPVATVGARWCALTDTDGRAAGFLEIVDDDDRHGSAKIDPAVLDVEGGGGWLSLTWSTRTLIPFDDVSVVAAVRACFRLRDIDFVSTLTKGDASLAGSVIGVADVTAEAAAIALRDDPFARLFERRLLQYSAGFFGRAPMPAGPSTQRYGSSTAWPQDRF